MEGSIKVKEPKPIHTNEICIKPNQQYIIRLYKELTNTEEYESLSALDKECLDIHVKTMMNGIQYYSSVSCETLALKTGYTKDQCKVSNRKLLDRGFLVISDITSNKGRNSYCYCYQLKDKTKKYYYDGWAQRTFKKKVYISTINKFNGTIERNTHVESEENRKLRLAGKYFCSWGIVNKKRKEGKVQVLNKSYKKENLSFLRESPRQDMEECFLSGCFLFSYEDKCSDKLFFDSKPAPEQFPATKQTSISTKVTKVPKPKPVKLTFEQKIDRFEDYYEKTISSHVNSLTKTLLRQLVTSEDSPDTVGSYENRTERRKYSVRMYDGSVGYAYISPETSILARDRLAIANVFYQECYDYLYEPIEDCFENDVHMLAGLWKEANTFDNEGLARLLMMDGQDILPASGKIPIWYYQKDGKDVPFGMVGKKKKLDMIFSQYGEEWGVHLNGDLVCLDFDTKESFYALREIYPQLNQTLVRESTRGFHVFFRVTNKIRKMLPHLKKKLCGVGVDCLSKGFVRFSTTKFWNNQMPLMLPYELFLEWREEEIKPQLKEFANIPQSKVFKRTFAQKYEEVLKTRFAEGERNTKAYRMLRSMRFGLTKAEYDRLAAGMFWNFEQCGEEYTWSEFSKVVEYAWQQPNREGFLSAKETGLRKISRRPEKNWSETMTEVTC